MDFEIVFTGLCSFLNLTGTNETMPDPSVILVRTDHHADMREPMKRSSGTSSYIAREPKPKKTKKHHAKANTKSKDAGVPKADPKMEHVAFIAFNSNTTTLATDPPTLFETVTDAPNFQFIRLDGVEIEIENDTPGKPRFPDDSYAKHVVRRDDYWPQAHNQWDRTFVPDPATGKKPEKTSVIVYLRFGDGEITAAKLCPFEWAFTRPDGSTHQGQFAEEVVYSKFKHTEDTVVIRLKDLTTGGLLQTLTFSALPGSAGPIAITIGNNPSIDIGIAVERKPPTMIINNDHFKFLNRTVNPAFARGFVGPLPVVLPAAHPPNVPPGVVAGSNGPCGPNNGNGG